MAGHNIQRKHFKSLELLWGECFSDSETHEKQSLRTDERSKRTAFLLMIRAKRGASYDETGSNGL